VKHSNTQAAREKEKAGKISDKLDAREEGNMDLKLQVAALQAELQTKVQMAPIGKVNGRFPPDMIFRLWRLLANLVSARKLPEIFKSEAKYFYGEDVKAEPPGHQRLSQYRQSLGVAAFLHSAWILATCVKCTLHTDKESAQARRCSAEVRHAQWFGEVRGAGWSLHTGRRDRHREQRPVATMYRRRSTAPSIVEGVRARERQRR